MAVLCTFVFFCDQPAGIECLHEVTTLELDQRVKECARVLSDDRLLAKLATGDLVALEAKYHKGCLSRLYNQRRSHEREQTHLLGHENTSDVSTDNLIFAQLVAYISEIRDIEGIAPIFKLSDLRKLCDDRLQQMDNPKLQPMHSTRLKEKLLKHFPDMRAQVDGRDVILVFDSNIGSALSKVC